MTKRRMKKDRPVPPPPPAHPRGRTAGERADSRLRELTERLNQGHRPKAVDIRPIA